MTSSLGYIRGCTPTYVYTNRAIKRTSILEEANTQGSM